MKNVEFCYWLQGFFEITEANKENEILLNKIAVECILKHLELVKKNDGKLESFASYLKGMLEIGGMQLKHNDDALEKHIVEKIKSELAAEFEHVIDKMYPNQMQLNLIHNASKPNKPSSLKPDTLIRC